jgi:HK97 family phage major capsid protein
MKTLKALIEARAAAVNSANALQEKATAEKRDLSADEITQCDAFLQKADELAVSIEQENAKKARADRLAAASASLTSPQPRPSQSGAPAPAAGTVELTDTAVTSGVHTRAQDDPKQGFRDYEDYCNMVYASSRTGVVDQAWLNRPEVAAALGNNTQAGEDGDFVVPPEFSSKLIERAMSGSPARAAFLSKVDMLQISGNSMTIPGLVDHDRSDVDIRHAGVVAYWTDEAAQVQRSQLKFRKIELKLHKVAALSYLTDEMRDDGVLNMGQRLTRTHGDALGEKIFNAVLFGTGVGQPLGVFSSNADGKIDTAKEGGQDADTITTDNILDMEANLASDSEPNALWLGNREGRKQVRLLKEIIGTSGELLRLFERGKQGGEADMLDGFPIYWTDIMKKLGDRADIGIVDPTKYVMISKGGPDTQSSVHLRFDYMETAWRTSQRIDGKPMFDKQLTPRNGATSKRESPYVTLAERA